MLCIVCILPMKRQQGLGGCGKGEGSEGSGVLLVGVA